MYILNVENIHKSFQENYFATPVEVLKGISFSLEPGTITGFLGANGAGKTTLIKILLGFISQTDGEVHWSREFGEGHRSIMKYIGFFPERPYFYPHLTGREFLSYTGRLSGMSKSEITSEVQIYSEMLNLAYALDRKVIGYSKGMLQRLGFISAIIHNPKLLIFDEPLSGLDPIGRQEFKDVLRKLHVEGKTIFFSSHIVPDIEEVCSDVLVLDKGKTFYHGSINTILKSHEKESYKVRYRKSGEHSESVTTLDSSEQLSIFLKKDHIEIITLGKERPRLEEIIYRSNQTND